MKLEWDRNNIQPPVCYCQDGGRRCDEQLWQAGSFNIPTENIHVNLRRYSWATRVRRARVLLSGFLTLLRGELLYLAEGADLKQ